MSQLTREQVLKLASLSKLRLSEEEITKYRKELSGILDYVEQLNDVNVEGLQPTYQVSGLQNITRPDEVRQDSALAEELMKRVPKTKDSFIQTGRMI